MWAKLKAAPKTRQALALWGRFRQAEVPVRAAALAYHSLLGVVPVVGLIFWYLSWIGVTKRWMQMTQTFILENLNVNASAQVMKTFEKLTGSIQGHSWGVIGLLVFLYTGFNLIMKFGDSIDVIIDSDFERPRRVSIGWIALFIRRLFILGGMPIALMASLVITTWIRYESWLSPLFKMKSVGAVLAMPVAWTVDIGAIFFVYWLVPSRPIPWKQAMRAALIAGPLFELGKFLIGFYNRYAISVHKIYGALAAIPLFFVWVQFAWMIILSGALLIRLHESTATRR